MKNNGIDRDIGTYLHIRLYTQIHSTFFLVFNPQLFMYKSSTIS